MGQTYKVCLQFLYCKKSITDFVKTYLYTTKMYTNILNDDLPNNFQGLTEWKSCSENVTSVYRRFVNLCKKLSYFTLINNLENQFSFSTYINHITKWNNPFPTFRWVLCVWRQVRHLICFVAILNYKMCYTNATQKAAWARKQ